MRHGNPLAMRRLGRRFGLAAVRMMIPAAVVCLLQPLIAAPDEPWPQYANIAPLPGAGLALSPQGRPDGLGAMQINIPVAYTPGWGFISLSAYAGNYNGTHKESFGNGTGLFGVGFFGRPSLYISAMQVSRNLDESKALNSQLMLVPEKPEVPAISVGYQDILRKEWGMRSAYFVSTKRFRAAGKSVYATIGYGGGRFLHNPFAGVSAPLNEHISLIAEYDGFQFNGGIGWRPGGRHSAVTFLGAYNGRAGWLAGAGVAVSLGTGH